MSEFTDDELIDYVQGVPSARNRLMESREQTDDEFAAQISLMCALTGRSRPAGRSARLPFVQNFRGWGRPRKGILVGTLVALLMCGGVWAGWAFLNRPLLEDHFRRRSFDSLIWTVSRPQVRQEYGHLKLTNRGYVVSVQEFGGPIDLRFRWRWLDLAENPPYSEDLAVVLRTTGQPKPERPFEANDGIVIKFKTSSNNVSVARPGWPPSIDSPAGGLPMPPEAWHDIRITDDGRKIAIYVTGPEARENSDKPVLEFNWDEPTSGRHIAFYNREMLAFTPHESHLTDVVIRKLD